MLKLTRKVQQAVVIHPRGKPDEALTMRVVDIDLTLYASALQEMVTKFTEPKSLASTL